MYPLSSTERPDYLPDCIVILGGIISAEGIAMHPKFDPTGVQTHDIYITTVHIMSLL